jgi:hypothetical protein
MLALCLAACEPTSPTEADGRAALEQKMRGLFPKAPAIGVTKFAKTNGTPKHVGGVSGYEMRYSATIEFPRGLSPPRASLLDQSEGEALVSLIQLTRAGFSLVKGGRLMDEPHILIADSVFLFQKTERGWAALP